MNILVVGCGRTGTQLCGVLSRMGHDVEIVNSNLNMGRGQIIWKTDNGLYIGGTEPRCDGTIAAW